jgi:hypothetical protein
MSYKKLCVSQSFSGPKGARAWSFYIFSSGSRLNELGRADFEGKGIEEWSLLCHLFA